MSVNKVDDSKSKYLLQKYNDMMTEIRSQSPDRISKLRREAAMESRNAASAFKLTQPRPDWVSYSNLPSSTKQSYNALYNEWELQEACKFPRERLLQKPKRNLSNSSRYLQSYLPRILEDLKLPRN
jgi:hypothetical protein